MNRLNVIYLGHSYTESQLKQLSGPDLVRLHNELAALVDDSPVKRFADKSTAVKRTWAVLVKFADSRRTSAPETTPAPKTEARKTGRARRGTNLQPLPGAPVACREGTKQALMVDMLSRENGATMAELLDALSGGGKPWTVATVRSGFGWDMKLKGYGVRSSFDADDTERFHLIVPAGYAIPAHRPLKGAAKADARQARLPV